MFGGAEGRNISYKTFKNKLNMEWKNGEMKNRHFYTL